MRKLFLFIITTLSVGFSYGQKAYQSGEYLKFKVRYGFLNTSYATLNLKEEMLDGKSVYHAVGYGATTGLAKFFFKVEDTYESYFDKKTVKPYVFVRDIYEGGYTKKLKAYFNHTDNTAMVHNLENGEKKTVSTPKDIQDVISAFYLLRNETDLSDLRPNMEITMDLLFDDDIFKFKLRYLREEKINTEFGEVETLVFRPLVQDGRVFKEQESLTLWISKDENKVPLKVKAELRVGSLTAELVDFKGLKNETQLRK